MKQNTDPIPDSLEEPNLFELTPHERAAGRMALQAKMSVTLTVDEKADMRRALQHRIYAEPVVAFSWSSLLSGFRLPSMALAAFVLLAASGGGMAYAAERALPGDALYGVKIHVNEALRARFVSPAERAQWALIRLERRVDELRRLEARGAASEEVDVAIGDSLERAAHEAEVEVGALPAAAAERAALRTAVNAAIGTDQDSLRRASRINRVLKALKERAEGFDAPTPTTIAPVPPSIRAGAKASASASVGPLRVNVNASAAVEVDVDVRSSSEPTTSSRDTGRSSSVRSTGSSEATASSAAAETSSEAEVVLPPLPIPGIDAEETLDGIL